MSQLFVIILHKRCLINVQLHKPVLAFWLESSSFSAPFSSVFSSFSVFFSSVFSSVVVLKIKQKMSPICYSIILIIQKISLKFTLDQLCILFVYIVQCITITIKCLVLKLFNHKNVTSSSFSSVFSTSLTSFVLVSLVSVVSTA